MMLKGFCRPVIIVMLLFPFVDSLIFKAGSHSFPESRTNQFYEIQEGELLLSFNFMHHMKWTFNRF